MKDLFSLKNETVIITGGSGYLGSAVVEGLLAHGATVVVADMRENEALTQSSDRCIFIETDASSSESIRSLMKQTYDQFGKIDVLINCATFGGGLNTTVDTMDDETWAVGINGAVGTTFRCTREVLPYMMEASSGSIVNFASMYGVVSPDPRIYGDSGANNPVNYGVAKAGVIQFTKYCAAHYAKYNIRVNAVTPGPFPKPVFRSNDTFKQELENKTMLGRIGSPRDIVGPVVLLSSSASAFMTGTNITVDGGWTAW